MIKRIANTYQWIADRLRSSAKQDEDKFYYLYDIGDKNRFLSWVIYHMPDGSVWAVDTVIDQPILSRLKRVQIRGKGKRHGIDSEVLLDRQVKNEILKWLPEWDLEFNFVHQSISFKVKQLFIACDNLDVVKISIDLGEQLLLDGSKEGLFTFKSP